LAAAEKFPRFLGVLFLKNLNCPCHETPKNVIKINKGKKKGKNEVSSYVFWGAAANVRHFRHFFVSRRPLARAASREQEQE
jgi:hypothetical protein